MTPETRNYSSYCWNGFIYDNDGYSVVNPDVSDFDINDNNRTFGIANQDCPVSLKEGAENILCTDYYGEYWSGFINWGHICYY